MSEIRVLLNFGLPVALFFCWMVVAPALYILMEKRISYRRAAFFGAMFGLGFTLLLVAIGSRSIDDLPTVLKALKMLSFCVFGNVAISLILRALFGPGREFPPSGEPS